MSHLIIEHNCIFVTGYSLGVSATPPYVVFEYMSTAKKPKAGIDYPVDLMSLNHY